MHIQKTRFGYVDLYYFYRFKILFAVVKLNSTLQKYLDSSEEFFFLVLSAFV